MPARGRKRQDDDGGRPAPSRGERPAAKDGERAAQEERIARGYARGRQKDAEARAKLVPLAPGERPVAVTVAAVVAAVLGAATIVIWAAGVDPGNGRPTPLSAIVFSGVMFTAAYFLWRRRYWAVLAFQALLGITLLQGVLRLLFASNVLAVVLSLVGLTLGGLLFWKLVRAMARLQLTERLERGRARTS